MPYPRAPSYLNSRLLGYVTIGYIEPSSHYLGNWSPRVRVLNWLGSVLVYRDCLHSCLVPFTVYIKYWRPAHRSVLPQSSNVR